MLFLKHLTQLQQSGGYYEKSVFCGSQPDALPVWGLGLVWLPGLKYIPRLTEHQKYITLVRIILSLPLFWLGVTTGGWSL